MVETLKSYNTDIVISFWLYQVLMSDLIYLISCIHDMHQCVCVRIAGSAAEGRVEDV